MVRSGTFCTRISPGCTHCYASAINKRFGNGLEFTVPNLDKVEFFVDERILQEPLKQKKPCTIFVGDMFDLFHEAIPAAMVDQVLSVAWRANQHTFQFLTKRAARMRDAVIAAAFLPTDCVTPPSHMWFGVSIEDQPRADERIPLLLQTPAAVRFLSVEPLLEAVNIHLPDKDCNHPSMDGIDGRSDDGKIWECNLCDGYVIHEPIPDHPSFVRQAPGIDWVICGGESGPGARPFNLAWAESLQEQCEAANVAFFMKQVGSHPAKDWTPPSGTYTVPMPLELDDSKGGDPSEWPESLRVREFPHPAIREAVSA